MSLAMRPWSSPQIGLSDVRTNIGSRVWFLVIMCSVALNVSLLRETEFGLSLTLDGPSLEMSPVQLLKKRIVIFESQGGKDKGEHGFRKDTLPLRTSLEARGWSVDIIKVSRSADLNGIAAYVRNHTDGFISRIDPGEWEDFDKDEYDIFLDNLLASGVKGFPKPVEMSKLGSKLILDEAKEMAIGLGDTEVYRTSSALFGQFPRSLWIGDRVLKRSDGALGSGVWHVTVANATATDDNIMESMIVAREAVDNSEKIGTLRDFLQFCASKYFISSGAYMVDQRYLPRIKEGEIRIVWIGNKAVHVVHRKPADGGIAFSAALNSGAVHTVSDPESGPFSDQVKKVIPEIEMLKQRIGLQEWPLLWTSDFILSDDTTTHTDDRLILGEINSSCVGFSNNPEFSESLADEIILRLQSPLL